MITVFLRGGLGNQLFQYSAGLYLARTQDTKVEFRSDLLPSCVDAVAGVSRWPSQLSEFSSNAVVKCWKNQPKGSTHFFSKVLQVIRILSDLAPGVFVRLGLLTGERNSAPNLLGLPKVWLVDSYCSSQVPALGLGDELRKRICEIEEPSTNYLELIREANALRPIIVHIRLGDYRNLKHLYGKPDFSRISSQVREVNIEFKSPVWVFSDSPEDLDAEFRKHMGVSKVLGPKDLLRPIENLVLMSKGSALICSNSTFSWWAAFLMGDHGSVYYPALDGPRVQIFAGDLILEGWRSF